ncbi:MAG: cell division protein FtsL [Oscillospiraceae bacterium]|nr:cell division protein FtsL [Oscillospiraceae bacterium]
MQNIKTFKSYNFVTGAVDGTLAYDFGNPDTYAGQEQYEYPGETLQSPEEQEWVKERPGQRTKTKTKTKTRAKEQAQTRSRVSAISVVAYACVVVLCVMLMLAQVEMMDLSSTAADLEDQISELETEKDKLTAEYETTFNLKDVEEYAESVLGMQEPQEDQIYYLSGVSAGDKAVVITHEETNLFSLGLEDLMNSVRAFVDGIFD